ncbi:hypothetical protein [Ponticaulis sp.]|uniref:hypothetical protein n=1 Tax=Ponticaulis sp. TaxID=2020902 RepID=UPI00260C3A46|nr:hypothetical protein [Ponticaulis sp.]MDF1680563.1 hypothetical protein [Ponticaulis sp.]
MNFLGWVLLPALTALLVGTIVMLSADGPAGVVTFLWGAGIIAAGVFWFLIGCLIALIRLVIEKREQNAEGAS